MNPNTPPVPPSVQRVPASGKSQHALELEELVWEASSSASETGESTQGVGQPVVNPGKPRVPVGTAPSKKKRGLAPSSRPPRPEVYS